MRTQNIDVLEQTLLTNLKIKTMTTKQLKQKYEGKCFKVVYKDSFSSLAGLTRHVRVDEIKNRSKITGILLTQRDGVSCVSYEFDWTHYDFRKNKMQEISVEHFNTVFENFLNDAKKVWLNK